MWENKDKDRHYIGTFEVNGISIPGEIIYNKANGRILLNLQREIEGIGLRINNQQYISGRLNDGCEIVLCNNRCIKNHTKQFRSQQIIFETEYFVTGKSDLSNHKFHKMVCTIENGLLWSGLSQLNTDDIDSIKLQRIEERPVFHWYGAQIVFSTELESDLWNLPHREACKFVERLQFEISCIEAKDVEYFIQVRNNIAALVSFAIKDNINFENQYLCNRDETFRVSSMDMEKKFYIYTNDIQHSLLNIAIHDYNFFLTQLPKNRDLSEILDKLIPVFNLYLSLFKYNEMPIEMIFLNLVQAVETFHARFFYSNKKDEYIQSINNRLAGAINFKKLKPLVQSKGQMRTTCKHITLLSRLSDLFIGENQGLFYPFYEEDSSFPQRVVDTRHYYTHYDKSKEKKVLKGDDLIDAINALSVLLEYYVCLEFGIDNSDKVLQYVRARAHGKSLA